MTVRDSLHARDGFIHTRVVLHRARTQGIHAEVNGVVPGGKPRKVADDLDLADLGHVAEIFSLCFIEKFGCVDFRHVERRQFPGSLPGRRLPEDQAFVVVDMLGRFARFMLHNLSSPGSNMSGGRLIAPSLPLLLWETAPNARFRRSPPRRYRSRCAWLAQCSTTK